jgi:hypothetical protein
MIDFTLFLIELPKFDRVRPISDRVVPIFDRVTPKSDTATPIFDREKRITH